MKSVIWASLSLGVAFVGELGGKRVLGSAALSDSTHTTIRGVDAVFCYASPHHSMRSDSRACFAGYIRFGDVEFRQARSPRSLAMPVRTRVTLCGVVSARVLARRACSLDPLLLFRLTSGHCCVYSKSRWSHSFCRRPDDRQVIDAGVRHETRSSGSVSSTPIPTRRGSQSVLCFSIDQATTAILRATAIAAFFLRVFWPPWMRS